jgi:hypothetical protein
MVSLSEIEAAVEALPEMHQKELFQHLAARLKESQERAELKRSLPLVPPTGNSITQKDIDEVLSFD